MKQAAQKPLFSFIDLFAGIGGLRMGFEKTGGRCVFTSELNSYSKKTYLANYSCDHQFEGDITLIHEKNIPAHDVLLAGFPCQPFSPAGKKRGFQCDTQGTLFFDIARIIAYHRPSAFLLENVKNLVSHNKKKTFRVILDTLEKELGYYVDWRVINSKSFVPQNRERVFVVGFKKDVDFYFIKMEISLFENAPKLKSILHPQNGSEVEEPPYTTGENAVVNPKYTLSDKLWACLQNHAAKQRAKGNGFGYGLVGEEDTARTLSARYCNDGAEILIRQKNKNPRRLTPRECSRLMGFDKPGESSFKITVSDTQAYRQFGNAVVVPVAEEIAKFMRPYILKTIKQR